MADETVVTPPDATAQGGTTQGNPDPQAAPAAGTGGAAEPNVDQLTESALNAFEKLGDDATAEQKAAAKDALTKAKTAREAAKATEKAKADKAAADKAAAEKAKGEAAKAQVSSAESLKLPETADTSLTGYLTSRRESIAQYAKENKLSLEQAQKMLDSDAASFQSVRSFGDAALKALQEKWDSEIKADPVLGGQNLNRTSQLAERALQTFFGKDFYEKELKPLHLSHHPTVVKQALLFAERMGEANLVPLGEKPAPEPEAPQTLGQRVYGTRGKDYDPTGVGQAAGTQR